jgi:acyl dehydratase
MKIVNNFDDLKILEGQELGVSDYVTITQEQINLFAEATNDFQWIHTDPEKAKTDSPFKKTIAHGYLTLSILPSLLDQIVDVRNSRLTVNYGVEQLKFGSAVVVDSKVRLRVSLASVKNLRGTTKIQMRVKLEIEGVKKPAYDGLMILLYHFEN